MATAKTLYQADDGSLFATEAEAQAHDAWVANKSKIDAFIDRHFPIPPKGEDGKNKQNGGRGPARKAIVLWLAENP